MYRTGLTMTKQLNLNLHLIKREFEFMNDLIASYMRYFAWKYNQMQNIKLKTISLLQGAQ